MSSGLEGPEAQNQALRLAEEYFRRLSLGEPVYDVDVESLRGLDPEVASALVTALFAYLFQTDLLLQEQGYMEGNETAELVSSLGHHFKPDIPALFEVYCLRHEEIAPTRGEWNRTKDDNLIFFETCHLSISWQLAWTISRAGLDTALGELSQFRQSLDPIERAAAVDLIEDVARYSTIEHTPQFGGGSGPPGIEGSDLVLENKSEQTTEIRVFYGTDRQRVESMPFYTGRRSDPARLHVGTCLVSIPTAHHQEGEVERPSLIKLSFKEDANKHIVLKDVEPQTKTEFVDSLKRSVFESPKGQMLVYIHGYRVTFEEAARQTAQLAYDLDNDLSLVPVFFSWPSRGKYLAYHADLANAEFSKPRLKEFLKMIARQAGAKSVHVIAHSMGNEALRYALKDIQSSSKTPIFQDLILTAPDIDADIFKNQIAPWLRNKAKRTTLYCSRTDKALWGSKLFRLVKAAGDEPIVVDGIDTIDVSGVDTSFVKHSYFRESKTILSDLYYLVMRGLDPDERRGPKRMPRSNGLHYWVLPP